MNSLPALDSASRNVNVNPPMSTIDRGNACRDKQRDRAAADDT